SDLERPEPEPTPGKEVDPVIGEEPLRDEPAVRGALVGMGGVRPGAAEQRSRTWQHAGARVEGGVPSEQLAARLRDQRAQGGLSRAVGPDEQDEQARGPRDALQ